MLGYLLENLYQISPHTFGDLRSKSGELDEINLRRQCLSKLAHYSGLVEKREPQFHFLGNSKGDVNVGLRPKVPPCH